MKKHTNVEEIFYVIGHNSSVFIKLTLRTLIFLLVLYVIYFSLANYIVWAPLPWVFGILGIAFFINYIISFLDLYLDILVLSPTGITLFMREGLFSYKTDFFDWSKIETVSHAQHNFRDKILNKGDLLIKLDHDVEYPFENISSPQKNAERILKYKNQYSKADPNKKSEFDDAKISILAEALGEVVKEYLDKKEASEEEEYDM